MEIIRSGLFFRKLYEEKKILNDHQIKKINFQIQNKVNKIFKFAENSKYPSKQLLEKYVYAK